LPAAALGGMWIALPACGKSPLGSFEEERDERTDRSGTRDGDGGTTRPGGSRRFTGRRRRRRLEHTLFGRRIHPLILVRVQRLQPPRLGVVRCLQPAADGCPAAPSAAGHRPRLLLRPRPRLRLLPLRLRLLLALLLRLRLLPVLGLLGLRLS